MTTPISLGHALQNLEASGTKIITNGLELSEEKGRKLFMSFQFTTLAHWFTTLAKDSRLTGLLHLSEGFKAHWFTTIAKDSRHTGLLHLSEGFKTHWFTTP